MESWQTRRPPRELDIGEPAPCSNIQHYPSWGGEHLPKTWRTYRAEAKSAGWKERKKEGKKGKGQGKGKGAGADKTGGEREKSQHQTLWSQQRCQERTSALGEKEGGLSAKGGV
jgi:hypothetical protein